MTLIASFSIQQHPILIGDLMLSRGFDDLSYKPFPIPTHDDVNRFLPNTTGRLITGLVQKVNLLSPRLAVAWAGKEDLAREVMHTLKKEVENPNFQWATLDTFLDRLTSQNENLSLIGLFLDGSQDEEFRIYRFECCSAQGRISRTDNWPVFKDCCVAGDGTTDFQEVAANYQSIREQSREINPLEEAVSLTMDLFGRFLNKQIRYGAGLDRFYGGGFELATFMKGEIRKFDNISYHFLDIALDTREEMTITFNSTLKFCYHQNFLLIRRLGQAHNENSRSSRDALYAIRPVYLSLSEEDKERLKESVIWPSLNSPRSVVNLLFPQCNKEASFVHMGSDDQIPLRYFETAEGVEAELSSALLERVGAKVRSLMGR